MSDVAKYTAIVVVAVLVTATTLSIGAAMAQLSKDNGASGLAGPAGGWMPQETPQQKPPIDPSAENPGNQALEAGIIGPDLKCTPGQPPC